jgi:uncharacterized protein (TIRG00374 family)
MSTQPATTTESKVPSSFPLKRFVALFFLFTSIGVGVLFYQAEGNSGAVFTHVLNFLRSPWVLLLALVLLAFDWYTDYLRYVVLGRYLHIQMPLKFGMKLVFANLFFAYLTPGGTFGAPMVIYMLHKRGEKLSNSIALALIKPFLLFFIMLASGPLMYFFVDLTIAPKTRSLLAISSGFMLILTILVASIIFVPKPARRLVDWGFNQLRALIHRRNPGVETPRLDRWEDGVDETIVAFNLFGKSGWKGILLALASTFLNLFVYICLSVALLTGLNIQSKGGVWDLWIFSYLYYFMIAFAPTPGGSGVAEGGGYWFFAGLGSKGQVTAYILLWRFFTCYLVMGIGATLFMRFVSKMKMQELDMVRHAHIQTESSAELPAAEAQNSTPSEESSTDSNSPDSSATVLSTLDNSSNADLPT